MMLLKKLKLRVSRPKKLLKLFSQKQKLKQKKQSNSTCLPEISFSLYFPKGSRSLKVNKFLYFGTSIFGISQHQDLQSIISYPAKCCTICYHVKRVQKKPWPLIFCFLIFSPHDHRISKIPVSTPHNQGCIIGGRDMNY